MAYKRITIEFENGRTRIIENPIAYKIWQWDDVETALRDDVLDYDIPEEEVKQKFETVKENIDEWALRGALEDCTDAEWYAIADFASMALEE